MRRFKAAFGEVLIYEKIRYCGVAACRVARGETDERRAPYCADVSGVRVDLAPIPSRSLRVNPMSSA